MPKTSEYQVTAKKVLSGCTAGILSSIVGVATGVCQGAAVGCAIAARQDATPIDKGFVVPAFALCGPILGGMAGCVDGTATGYRYGFFTGTQYGASALMRMRNPNDNFIARVRSGVLTDTPNQGLLDPFMVDVASSPSGLVMT